MSEGGREGGREGREEREGSISHTHSSILPNKGNCIAFQTPY